MYITVNYKDSGSISLWPLAPEPRGIDSEFFIYKTAGWD
jgi:hypothetical protein